MEHVDIQQRMCNAHSASNLLSLLISPRNLRTAAESKLHRLTIQNSIAGGEKQDVSEPMLTICQMHRYFSSNLLNLAGHYFDWCIHSLVVTVDWNICNCILLLCENL